MRNLDFILQPMFPDNLVDSSLYRLDKALLLGLMTGISLAVMDDYLLKVALDD